MAERVPMVSQEVRVEPVGVPGAAAIVVKMRDEDLWLDLVEPGHAVGKVGPHTAARVSFGDALGLYAAQTTILSAGNPTPGRLVVARPAKFEAVQRRQFFRVDIVVPFTWTSRAKPAPQKATTLDLSGGGLRFQHDAALPADERLQISLPLGPGVVVATAGRVVRSWPSPAAPGKFMVAVEFQGIPERSQDRVIAFLLDAQRKERAAKAFR